MYGQVFSRLISLLKVLTDYAAVALPRTPYITLIKVRSRLRVGSRLEMMADFSLMGLVLFLYP
jgi:hypothetical protein